MPLIAKCSRWLYGAAVSHPYYWSEAVVDIMLNDLTPDELQCAPEGFRALCRMTSEIEALALCERFGGLDLWIPAPDTQATKLTELRGELRDILCEASYDRLLKEWGGDKFLFPRLNDLKRKRRNRLIRARIDLSFAQKESMEKAVTEVVREYGVHRRHVFRILKGVD
jgi:hypothetical protein